uniref:FPV140 protein n=2 Tax=unclassified Avipoxvirus TaxID=336487 RepID=F8R4X5_9POXV|nr:FPV140 protein [Avipoxvirus India/07/2009]AEB40190.1 FPV140 protein [Avipoxvirus India/08/2009]
MAPGDKKQIVFVIATIGRSPSIVVPFKSLEVSEWSYKRVIKNEYDDHRDPPSPQPLPKSREEVKAEGKVGDIEYDEMVSVRDGYYSDVCRLTCTEDTKTFIADHISLWRYIMDNTEKLPNYVIIIEDDNTITGESFITNLDNIIKILNDNNVDVLQLVTHTKLLKDRKSQHLMLLPDLEAFKGSFDVSLSAYIIRQDAVRKLYSYFTNNKPNFDISLEILRVENTLGITRYVMDNDRYVHHDYKLANEFMKNKKNRTSIKSRIDGWIMDNWPSFYHRMYYPLFSVFGKYDITMMFLIAIVVIIGLAIFDVNNKLLWLLSGIFLAYSM